MAASTVPDFLDMVKSLPILEATQNDRLDELKGKYADLKTLGAELIRRQWLTPFQVNQIVKHQGQSLVLDQYLLIELLGQGGAGAVYKARHRRMDRLVALKVMRKECLASPVAVERFHREAKAVARLSHPNVVTVFDANEVRGIHFLAMEYIEGVDLARVIKREGPQPMGRACDYIRQAALGLQHAHEKGLVHRDIKPHNLMLTKDGIIKLMDLGLARIADGEETSMGLTKIGVVMGTPEYIAPEQAMNAKQADIRADIYSLGCTLYHLLAGRTPFGGGVSLAEILLKHQMDEPERLQNYCPACPPALTALVRKTMAKKPEGRFQTPAELAEALLPFAQSCSAERLKNENSDQIPVTGATQRLSVPAPIPERSRRTLKYVAASIAGILLLGGGVIYFSPKSPPATDTASAKSGSVYEQQTSVQIEKTAEAGPEKKNPGKDEPKIVKPKETPKDTEKSTPPDKPKPTEKPKELAQELKNSIGMTLRLIKPDAFQMGEKRLAPAEPPHGVKITKPFYMGIHEVTQEEYNKVMHENPSFHKKGNPQLYPVETVNWLQAQDFCKTLSALEEESKKGLSYRLPTEAEWEFACRAGTKTHYAFGDVISSKDANFAELRTITSFTRLKDLFAVCEVNKYKPNDWGLYNMHGNVWEWCSDWYGKYPSEDQTDPQGPDTGVKRVVRGGSFKRLYGELRSAYRSETDPSTKMMDIGFRVVCVPVPKSP